MVSQPRRSWLEMEQIGEATVAKFTTRHIVDEEKVGVIGKQLLRLGEQAGHRSIVLNFSAVERISTEMLGKLVALQKKVQDRGGRLALCQVNPNLQEIFKLFKLPRLLTIYDDEQEALQTL